MSMKSFIREHLLTVFPVEQADVLATVVVDTQQALASKDDIHDLRSAITGLAEAQQRTESKVGELAEAQQRTEAKVGELAEAQQRTEARVGELAEAQQRTEAEVSSLADTLKATQKLVGDLAVSQQFMGSRIDNLAELHQKMMIRVDRADGRALEWSLQTRLPAFAGRWIKRCRVLPIQELVESLEPLVSTGVYTEADLDQLSYTDIVASGVLDGEKVYIVGEVSCTGDREDIERAAGRAALLSKAGTRALPFIACDTISSKTVEQAKSAGVRILLGSRLLPA
jgi:hypothetical protein